MISVDRRADGSAGVGMVARSGVTPGQVEDLVREAEKAAAEAPPAEDAADLVTGEAGDRSGSAAWSAAPAATDFGVFRSFAAQLGETLRAAEAAGRKLYGFAEHEVTSTFVGTSTGVRARHDQPTGRLELNAKSADLSPLGLGRGVDAGLHRRGRAGAGRRARASGWRGSRGGSSCPPGATRRCCRRPPSPTC